MVIRRQRLTGILLTLFFLVLAGLTIFSNTIQSVMLPKVTTEKPVKKTLSHFIKGDGMITPRQMTALVNESGWKAAKVHVHDNERVKKGQVLITFDSTKAQQQLLDEEARL
ncbi:Biotin-lipoyl like [Paenibacillus algorifonticola]|uniref:Biotin-lipoyl like n=1 Tax=Paenibacillus algorifonticola TaxID=684063 RepID=A0A1I2DM63_9BACL|nr:efflux RND transporter periplasmic adaptor subunit [Paenibacillus algorifonticola]SFE81518.1 Biotin-lipoyl like [Paenibacillus algorifonticola]